jgi:hypothetical protein
MQGWGHRAGDRYRTGALLAMRAKVLTSIAAIVRGGPIPKVGKFHLKGIWLTFTAASQRRLAAASACQAQVAKGLRYPPRYLQIAC